MTDAERFEAFVREYQDMVFATAVRLLGHEGALAFTQDTAGLHVTLPGKAPGEHAFAFRIEGVS